MVHPPAPLAQGRQDAAPAVGFERVADRGHGLDEGGVVGGPHRGIVVGGARQTHQPASRGDSEAAGPVITDIGPLRGGGPLRRAPFKDSSSSACRPTSRLSAAMRAS